LGLEKTPPTQELEDETTKKMEFNKSKKMEFIPFNPFSLNLDFRVQDDLHFVSDQTYNISRLELKDMFDPFNPFSTPDFRVADDLLDFHPDSKKGKRMIEKPIETLEKSSEKRSCQGLTTHSTSPAVFDLVNFFGDPRRHSIRSTTLPFHQWCSRQLPVMKKCCSISSSRHVKYNETGEYYTILRKFAEDKKYPTTKCERYYSCDPEPPKCLISTRGSSRWGDWEADKIAHDDVPEDLLKEMYLSSSLEPNRFAPFELIDNRRAGWDSFRCEFAAGRHGIVLEPYSGFRACFSVVIPAVQCPECADNYNLKETDTARVTHIPFIGLTTSSTFPGGNWLALMWKMNGTILWSKRSGDCITTTDTDLYHEHGGGCGCDYFDLHKQEFAHTCEFLVCCTTTPRVYFFMDYEECTHVDVPKLFYGQEIFPCFPMSLLESIQTPNEFTHQFTQTGGKPFDE